MFYPFQCILHDLYMKVNYVSTANILCRSLYQGKFSEIKLNSSDWLKPQPEM